MAWEYYRYSQKFEMHMSHIDKDDLKQIADIAIFKAYDRYDHEFTKDEYENYDKKNCIGFYPFLKKTIKGEILRYIRDSLKIRRKDYNIHEIAVTSSDMPLSNQKGDSEIFLKDIIEDEYSSNDFKTLELKLEIEEYMNYLTDIEKNIVHSRFYENLTQKQIGEKYNMSQVHVSRVLKKAIEKMKFASTIKRKHIKTNKIHKEHKEEIVTMKKGTIDTVHALNYFKEHLKDEKPLDYVMNRYCEALDISKSELIYILHTTCSSEYNKVVDLYMKYENDIEIPETSTKRTRRTNRPNIAKQESKTAKEDKEERATETMEKTQDQLLKDVNVIELTLRLNSFDASICQSHVTLVNLPESVKLSVKDLKSIRDDIDKLIKIKENISLNAIK